MTGIVWDKTCNFTKSNLFILNFFKMFHIKLYIHAHFRAIQHLHYPKANDQVVKQKPLQRTITDK